MHFSDYKSHNFSLFVSSRILPVKLVCFKLVASLVHDVGNQRAYLFAPQRFTPTPHDSHKLEASIKKCRKQISSCFPFLELVLKYGMASLLNWNPGNLININCSTRLNGHHHPMTLCTFNARSVKNKSADIVDYVCDCKADLFAITETWLGADDAAVRAELCPDG